MKQETKVGISSFPTRLKQLRIGQGWPQEELGKKINLDSQKVSKLERGLKKPDMELLFALSQVFHISIDYLLTGKDFSQQETFVNREFVKRIPDINKIDSKNQEYLLALLDAFIKQQKFEELAKR